MRLYGVLSYIISNRGPQCFTSQFWKLFQKGLGTHVNLRTTFYPQMDDQEDHTIHTIEDILGACVIVFKRNCDDHLPLKDFTYNNCYHSSIQMALYEALCERKFM